MKKLSILALAVVLVAAFTVPASALKNKFGGYWRTRFFSSNYFSGNEDIDEAPADDPYPWNGEQQEVDTRTRLYYTAIINDHLRFVNKFEMDANWGREPYGDISADGVAVEVKNTYAEWNMGPMTFDVGVQGWTLARGFLFADDAAGIQAVWKAGDMFTLGAGWIRGFEGGIDRDDEDVDILMLTPEINVSKDLSIKPYAMWLTSSDPETLWTQKTVDRIYPEFFTVLDLSGAEVEDTDLYFVGVDVDATFGPASLWLTAIYEGGSVDTTVEDFDVSAYLAAVGGAYNFGMGDIHGEVFYASGDDDFADEDIEEFFIPIGSGSGQSYYWAEIMGFGIFDDQASAGSPAEKISNVMAANLGITVKPMDKLKTTLDVWYARLVEDDVNGEDYLGTEVDLIVTYQLVQDLNLDLVGAYLFAGDATSTDGNNEDDPYEVGARLSLSF